MLQPCAVLGCSGHEQAPLSPAMGQLPPTPSAGTAGRLLSLPAMGQLPPTPSAGTAGLPELLQQHSMEMHAFFIRWMQQQSALLDRANMTANMTTTQSHLQVPNKEIERFESEITSGKVTDKFVHFDSADDPSTRGSVVGSVRTSINRLSQTMKATVADAGQYRTLYYRRHMSRLNKRRCCGIVGRGGCLEGCSLYKTLLPVLVQIECSLWFQLLICIVIALNTTMLCISMETAGSENPVTFDSWDWVFVAFYTGEIVLRVLVHQFDILAGPDARWNLLDILLVFAAWTEQIRFDATFTSGNMSYLRAMRLVKIAKILRIFRLMRAFRQLRYILDSIVEALPTLLWTILLMSSTMLIFSLAFMQGALDTDVHLRDGGERAYWTSIGFSMLDLLMAVTGGVDWEGLLLTLWGLGPGYVMTFIFYIILQLLVVFNAIQSTFVQRMLDHVTRDDYVEMANRLKQKSEFIRKLVGIFKDMDKDGDGLVSLTDLNDNMNDARMLAFAHSLDMEEEDMDFCFSALTHGGNVSVDIDTFVTGCIKLRGAAKSLDMIDLNRELLKTGLLVRSMHSTTESFVSDVKEDIKRVVMRLDAMAFQQERGMSTAVGPAEVRMASSEAADIFTSHSGKYYPMQTPWGEQKDCSAEAKKVSTAEAKDPFVRLGVGETIDCLPDIPVELYAQDTARSIEPKLKDTSW